MFETLSKGFRTARNQLAGVTELTEENLEPALRQVRLSLLEADVELGIAKEFLARVQDKAIGQTVRTRVKHEGQTRRVGAAEQFIRICQEELEGMMATPTPVLTYAPRPQITGIMLVGLQGTGKTTTAAKLARLLESEHERKPLLVAADTQRPGAIEQLQTLGERIEVPVFRLDGATPIEICQRARDHARKIKRDVIIYDTAGRLAIDDALMQELIGIRDHVNPQHTLLVVDAMMGQDSVQTAKSFHQAIDLSGLVMTKLDGDARGGAALSAKEATGVPIKFVGMGEALDKLEVFRPDGMASRILGFGDVVSLMKDFEQVADTEKAEEDAKRMLQGQFTLEDFLEQLQMIRQMGPLQDVMEKLPFFADSMPEGAQIDDSQLVRLTAMVNSMTPDERRGITLFQKQPNRVRRVAKGSGRSEREVAELLQRFMMMRQMFGNLGKQAGLLGKMPGMRQLAAANRLKDQVRLQGLEHNPMMSNLAESLLEAAVANQPHAQPAQATKKGQADRAKRKNRRKQQRKARKKSRK